MENPGPIEKVYEAWSALADGRVSDMGSGVYQVESSDHSKKYTIKYIADTDTYYSNDNATLWRGYPGYPILAVMMMRGALPVDYEYIQQWSGINWNAVNARYKRDYAAALTYIEAERGIDSSEARRRADLAYDVLNTYQQGQFKPLRGVKIIAM